MKRLLRKWLKRKVYDIYPNIYECPNVFEYIYDKPLHKWKVYLFLLRKNGGMFQDKEEIEDAYDWLNKS